MISKNEITSTGGAAAYFDKSFNQDGVGQADNYYVGEKSSATWQGRGAEIIGVKGELVKREDFVSFLEGRLKNPATGKIQDLSKTKRDEDRRFGVDFTVAPPKSVSIISLVGGDERIIDAHLAANERAMAWLEKNASVVRVIDENGERAVRHAGNLLYATVQHETNRNNEPHLHNHNVIVSAVFDEKSAKWRSLTNDQLYELRQSADVIYKTELAAGLHRAGYPLTYSKNGIDFEIAGMTREQIEAYSTRTTEIVKALKDRGIEYESAGFHQQQLATLATRAAKNEQPRDVLHSVWEEIAEVVKLDVKTIIQDARSAGVALENSSQQLDASQKGNALKAVSWAVAHLSEREQSFGRAEIEVTALKFGSAKIDQIEQAVDARFLTGNLVKRGLSHNGAILLTTNTAVANENELVRNIRDGIGRGRTVLTTDEEFGKALNAFEIRKSQKIGTTYMLSGEQVETARNILMHGDVYQGVQGDAGTGKTAALEMVREVAEAKGWVVMGVATTSSAAKELEASSGIKSQTVAGFLNGRDNALRQAKIELAELRSALVKSEYSSAYTLKSQIPFSFDPVRTEPELAINSDKPRVEIHKLTIKLETGERGTARYAFNYESGEVFKSPEGVRNQLGNFLLDVSDRRKNQLSSGAVLGETLAERLRDRTTRSGNQLVKSIGTSLMTFEKVGMVDAISARDTLHIKLDGEVGNLRFKIGTKQAEINNLQNFGNKEGKKIMLVMDESSMTGARDLLTISRIAKDIEARVVFQGDVKQHGSVPAGRAFEQALQAGMNKSVLQETRRFDNATESTKLAVVLMNSGKIAEAISRMDRIEVENKDLHKTTAERYLKNLEDLKAKGISSPNIGIVTLTNDDRKEINAEVHKVLVRSGHITGQSFTKQHLNNPKLTEAQQLHSSMLRAAEVDHLVFRKSYQEIGVNKNDVVRVTAFNVAKNTVTIVNARGQKIEINPKQKDYFTPVTMESREYGAGDKVEARSNIQFEDKKLGRIDNGARGVISSIDEHGATIKWIGVSASDKLVSRETRLNNNQMRMVDLSYARTTFKEQGATNDREIISVSEIGAKVFYEQAAYVAGTRAKYNSEIVTSDYETMLKNAGKQVDKTTAIDIDGVKVAQIKEPIKDMSKDNAKTQENINLQDREKSIEKDKSQDRSRTVQRGFVLE